MDDKDQQQVPSQLTDWELSGVEPLLFTSTTRAFHRGLISQQREQQDVNALCQSYCYMDRDGSFRIFCSGLPSVRVFS